MSLKKLSINVADTVNIGEEMTRHFINSLPEGFHKSIAGEIVTMETMKRRIIVGDAMINDMEALLYREIEKHQGITFSTYALL